MKSVSVGNVTLALEDRGGSRSQAEPSFSKPALLLVHGFPLDHTMWREQIEYFSVHGRVIAPDLRGFGESSNAPDDGSELAAVSMAAYADDLAALLDQLGVDRPIVFCGLSMGGYIAWQFCKKHGRRLAALVVCDTRAIADSPQAAAGRAELAKRTLTEGTEPVVAAMLPKFFGPETIAQQRPCVADTVAAMHRASPIGIASALGAMATRPDMTASLAEIRVPTLVVVGEHDVISTADEMHGIAERIADAELVVIPGAGHISPLEDPEAFNHALERFLREKAGWN
ncbi:MAG TPA: alpha/beta fold hydrolase [Pirellulales bacterium]|jgi:pimeloyl-ACP methyl ester carboxylesterase|nr:alpha/beta fold hydrolase [Pirellulales bacterium]